MSNLWWYIPYLGWMDLDSDIVKQTSLDPTRKWEGFILTWLGYGIVFCARTLKE